MRKACHLWRSGLEFRGKVCTAHYRQPTGTQRLKPCWQSLRVPDCAYPLPVPTPRHKLSARLSRLAEPNPDQNFPTCRRPPKTLDKFVKHWNQWVTYWGGCPPKTLDKLVNHINQLVTYWTGCHKPETGKLAKNTNQNAIRPLKCAEFGTFKTLTDLR